MYTVYGKSDSGNCYKVKLALEQLGLPYRWVEVDSNRGETRSAEFLARNPIGKVPTLGLQERGNQALAVMEQHLGKEPFFPGPAYGIADIALFAYTHCAADGGFDLGRYPAVSAWLARVRRQPRFVPLPA